MALDKYMEPIVWGTLRVLAVHDHNHETEGSYAYDTEEETHAAEDHERDKLESGEWVALGFVKEEKCSKCGGWDHVDSLWGIVIENSEAKVRQYMVETGFLNAEGKVPDA